MNETNYELESIQQQLSGVWPNWRVTKKLGNGSYGSVYEIIRNDLAIKYTCALKVLNMRAQDSGHYESADYTVSIDRITDTDIDEFVHGVTSEIEAMIRLKGVPNIVTIEDYALLRTPYGCTILIRMEELEPMESYFKRKGGSPAKEDLVRLGTDICSALSFCEKNNILHRDIKPGNLFYSEKAGFKLGDFGISRTMDFILEKASMSGIGTPRYIAPEIYHGERYNNTADIYSLGLVLYVLANGSIPPLCDDEPGLSPDSLSTSRLHEANMRRLNEGKRLPPPRYADEALASVICTACEPKPENRFQTAEAFRNALVSDLSPLAGLDRLTRLDLYANDIMDITPIAGLTQLRNLDIRANKIQDISPLKDMVLMEKLYMSDNMDLYDLSPLSNMPSLHYLSVKNTSVSQINPLKNDTNLDSLIIRQTNVSDISVVDSLSSLAYLDIRNCPIHDYGPANRFADRKGTKLEK